MAAETPEGVALELLQIILAAEASANAPPIKPIMAHILDAFAACLAVVEAINVSAGPLRH